MINRAVFAVILLGAGVAAQAEVIEAPRLLQYAPNMLSAVIDQQRLPFQGALPVGSGGVIVAFSQLLGLIGVWKSLSIAWGLSDNVQKRGEGGWGGFFVFFIAGVMVFHLSKTMAMLAATIPGFPDLTPVLRY